MSGLDGSRNTEQLETESDALHVLVSVFTHDGLWKKKIWSKNRILDSEICIKLLVKPFQK